MSKLYKKVNFSANFKKSLFLFLFIFLLNFSSAFAQSTVVDNDLIENSENGDTSTNTTVTTSSTNSNVNFILWFMGTKEDPNKVISNDGLYTKKQVISSGTVPNHLLLRILLRKTVNSKFC